MDKNNLNSIDFNIPKMVAEYEKFFENYNKGEMYRLRASMNCISKIITSKLQNCKKDMPIDQMNQFNDEMNKLNDDYNNDKAVYTKIIDTYFPYTQRTLPQLMNLLHDDKFNYFSTNTYIDVLQTYKNMTTGKTTIDDTMNKVNNIVKMAVPNK